jgi:hypothetical protein
MQGTNVKKNIHEYFRIMYYSSYTGQVGGWGTMSRLMKLQNELHNCHTLHCPRPIAAEDLN